MSSTPKKFKAILKYQVKLTKPVRMCGYKLATKWQNFT